MSRVVVALGGNALGTTPEEQLKLVKKTAKQIVKIVANGHEVVVVHGNGPQVGAIKLATDYANSEGIGTPSMPFAECGAMSQGYIGYHLQQSISRELERSGIKKNCVTIITQVEVSKYDDAFHNPTKPVGMFYTQKEAQKIADEKGYKFVEDAGRGYRRVVPSPKPVRIIEEDVINDLIDENNVVITAGGGGIPVIKENGSYKGVDAVIDKDFAASLLARQIKADILLILTSIDKVYINYGKENAKGVKLMSLAKATEYINQGYFAKGSMLPKVEASCEFVQESPKKKAIITSLNNGLNALSGKTGTIITQKGDGKKRRIEMAKAKNKKFVLSSFSIILLIIIFLGLITHFLPTASFVGEEIVNGSGVVAASLSDILLAPILGFKDAIDVCIFIFILGGFLAIVNGTGALETGIKVLIKKMKGKEIWLIPILMFIFSVGGTTYGMLEETVGFYALLSATMVVAGMDTIIASAIVLFGAGVGVLGSTINPFAVGVAIDALPKGIEVNQGIIIGLGVALWLVSYAIATAFVMAYAKKVKADKGSTFLSLREQKDMEKTYLKPAEKEKETKLTGKQKFTLVLFGITFLIMIIGFIPWDSFGINTFLETTGKLTGNPLGWWYFQEASLWFFIMAIIIGIVNRDSEPKFVSTFVNGAADMMGVILIVAVARGASVLMTTTHLDNYIIYNAAEALRHLPPVLFAPLDYLLHIVLSILVPSSSGLATLSTPIMGPLAHELGFSVETTIMIFVAANGLVNLITPTCGAIMGGLALAKVEYSTWFKWAIKVVAVLAIAAMIILTVSMIALS